MTLHEVPVTLVLGDWMLICEGCRTFRAKIPTRKQRQARQVAIDSFEQHLRVAIRDEPDRFPSWNFS